MPVRVNYHGILKDITGKGTEDFKYVNTVALLKEQVFTKYPGMGKYVFIVAVNGVFGGDETGITQEDRIEIIPPMPGG